MNKVGGCGRRDLKAPFSIATAPRCSGGRHSFLWIAPFYP